MSRLDELVEKFEKHIATPWQKNLSGAEKLVMIVYPKEDELRMRVGVEAFRQASESGGHPWFLIDLTDAFPSWLGEQEYREEYFRFPEDIEIKLEDFTDYCAEQLRAELNALGADQNSVIAILGGGSLFGLTRLHKVIEKVHDAIRGRLVVLFPGSYEQNNYRLLDGREGWTYLATPIVC